MFVVFAAGARTVEMFSFRLNLTISGKQSNFKVRTMLRSPVLVIGHVLIVTLSD